MNSWRIVVVVAVMTMVAAGGAVLGFAGRLDSAAEVGRTAARDAPPTRALLVSDSAWLGVKTYGATDGVRGFDHMLDLASCRRRVSRSCTNYDGHVPVTLLDELEWRGNSYNTLIVATGYNDSDRTFDRDVDAIVELARTNGYERVVWLTLRSNVSYESPDDAGSGAVFERSNARLHELVATGRYPEIVIADWATYARDRPEWFAGDGIHLRQAGPWAAGDYVSRKLAFLDQRPCPMPARPGSAIEHPCPDPDDGPLDHVDVDGLYPVGESSPDFGFFMEWEGQSSWPETPWWS